MTKTTVLILPVTSIPEVTNSVVCSEDLSLGQGQYSPFLPKIIEVLFQYIDDT